MVREDVREEVCTFSCGISLNVVSPARPLQIFCFAYSSVRMWRTRDDINAASAIAILPVRSRCPITSIRIFSSPVWTYSLS